MQKINYALEKNIQIIGFLVQLVAMVVHRFNFRFTAYGSSPKIEPIHKPWQTNFTKKPIIFNYFSPMHKLLLHLGAQVPGGNPAAQDKKPLMLF